MHSDTRFDIVQTAAMVCQSIFTVRVGLPATRTRYDALGRVIARVDQLGNTTTMTYSSDGLTVSVLNPNTSTRVATRSASGDTLSVTGTAVTPEFHFYSVTNIDVAAASSPSCNGETPLLHPGDPDVAAASSPSQISCRVHETRYGSASSPRFTRTFENLLGQTKKKGQSLLI